MAAEQWILDRSTFERIKQKTGYSKMGKWKQVQEYAKHIPAPIQRYMRNREKASHVLLLDATFTKVLGQDRAIMIAYDTGMGVVDYWVDVTENKTAYFYIFQRLDKAGYRPKCVVSDGHFSILPIIRERNLPHQRCLFHLLQELKRKMLRGQANELYGRDRILYSRIKWILKTKYIEDLPGRITLFRERTCPIFNDKPLALKWFWENIAPATLHLSYLPEEKVPNGTHLLENLNGQIKQRLKTMRGVKSERSLNNLLKILFYLD